MNNFVDLTGRRFGKLIVIERVEINQRRQTQWRCQCDCGNEVVVTGGNLVSGNTKSCGCYHSEVLAELNKARATHGKSGTRLYRIWIDMRRRCTNPKCAAYANCGGMGIKVYNEWMNSFPAFQEWALSNGYQENLSIHRIDANGNYQPANCRWGTAKERNYNQRRTA